MEGIVCRDPDVRKSLDERGFCVLRGLTDAAEWDDAFACPLVHHGRLLQHVRECTQVLDEMLGWQTAITKLRASASCERKTSNATDAAALHRDIACYDDNAVTSPPPIFTLVIYLNDTTMNVAPGTHKRLRFRPWETLRIRPQTQHVKAGDAVLFFATLLHAGSFTDDAQTERRVVQCFEIFPLPSLARTWSPKTVHVWCADDEKQDRFSAWLSAAMSRTGLAARIMSQLHLSKAACGYRIDRAVLPSDVSIVSGESWRKRLTVWDEFVYGNVYAPVGDAEMRDATLLENQRLRAQFYGTQEYLRLLSLALLPPLLAGLTFAARRRRRRPTALQQLVRTR